MRNLHKVQGGRGVNAPGLPEIPASVFEELLVNALAHRDYLVSAPIRLFIYDNRIEIISPGHLPNNLTVEKIKTGNANIRNPILVSYVAKGLLPYHGLGSGIKRALTAWPDIIFADDHEGCLFTAIVRRKAGGERDASAVSPTPQTEMAGKLAGMSGKMSGKILEALRGEGALTIPELAERFGVSSRTVERALSNLRNSGFIRREGPAKGGKWEVVSE